MDCRTIIRYVGGCALECHVFLTGKWHIGLLMQPIVGVLSDRCTSRFGRRRPFLILGSIVVIFSLLVIGWTREITSLFTASQDGETVRVLKNQIYQQYMYTNRIVSSSRLYPLPLPSHQSMCLTLVSTAVSAIGYETELYN